MPEFELATLMLVNKELTQNAIRPASTKKEKEEEVFVWFKAKLENQKFWCYHQEGFVFYHLACYWMLISLTLILKFIGVKLKNLL